MGASRKLQGEIDRVLKKVQEGVDVFDSMWNKVNVKEDARKPKADAKKAAADAKKAAFEAKKAKAGSKKEVKKETGLGLKHKKDENFGEWYSEVVLAYGRQELT